DWVTDDMVRSMGNRGKIDFLKGGPVEDEIREIVGQRHRFDHQDNEAVSVWNTALEMVLFHNIMDGMNHFFVSVSIITLVLGGIGVMNIMLVAVRERTKRSGCERHWELRQATS